MGAFGMGEFQAGYHRFTLQSPDSAAATAGTRRRIAASAGVSSATTGSASSSHANSAWPAIPPIWHGHVRRLRNHIQWRPRQRGDIHAMTGRDGKKPGAHPQQRHNQRHLERHGRVIGRLDGRLIQPECQRQHRAHRRGQAHNRDASHHKPQHQRERQPPRRDALPQVPARLQLHFVWGLHWNSHIHCTQIDAKQIQSTVKLPYPHHGEQPCSWDDVLM